MNNKSELLSGNIFDADTELTLAELSQACRMNAEWIMALVDEGILEPLSAKPHCTFGGVSVFRARTVLRLQRDLGVNMAGAALALELLQEIDTLRSRLEALDSDNELFG